MEIFRYESVYVSQAVPWREPPVVTKSEKAPPRRYRSSNDAAYVSVSKVELKLLLQLSRPALKPNQADVQSEKQATYSRLPTNGAVDAFQRLAND